MNEVEDEPLFAERAAGIDIARGGASRRPGRSPRTAANCCRWQTGRGPGA
jgi:hypothetical protein